MARKNIIPKTVYIPEESEQMWLKVKEYIGMESDSAVIWNLIQTKFFEVKDGKGKRQVMQEMYAIVELLQKDTCDAVAEIRLLSEAVKMVIDLIGNMSARITALEQKVSEHGFE